MNEQVVYWLEKLNSTIERIEKQNEESNAYLHGIAFEIKRIANDVLSLENSLDVGRVITLERCIESISDTLSRGSIEIEGLLQAIQNEQKKTSFHNMRELEWVNEKLSSIVDYIDSQSFYDADDDDTKKNLTNAQLAMMIQSLKRIEQSLSQK
jgi:hypothetical protein